MNGLLFTGPVSEYVHVHVHVRVLKSFLLANYELYSTVVVEKCTHTRLVF